MRMRLHYRIAWLVIAGLARLLWGFRVTGRERIPALGPVIIASNHISNWDPILTGLACPREMFFMAKRELFANKAFAALIRAYNAIPLDRGGGDRRALRTARRILAEDRALLMFPEGTRSRSGELGQGRPGVAFLAASSGAKIVPAYITGSDDPRRAFRRRGSVRVSFAKPIIYDGPTSTEGYAETTVRVMASIAELKGETTSA